MPGMETFGSTLTVVPDWNAQIDVLGTYANNLRWLVMGADVDASNNIRFHTPMTFVSSTNNAGDLLTLDQDTNNNVLVMTTDATTQDAVTLAADSLTTAGLMNLTSNSSDTGTRTLFILKNDNTAATGATNAVITQDAAATNVRLTNTAATGVALDVVADSITTQAGVFNVSVDAITTGKAARVESTSTVMTSAELLTVDHTATSTAGTGLSAKSGNLVSIASSLTEARTGGTTALDFDMLSLTRTAETTGASGTMTNTGSVLRIATVLTQTAGTLTDTTKGIELVMSANGTGTGVFVDSNATGAIGIDVDAENTTVPGVRVVVDALTTSYGVTVTSSSADTSGRALLHADQQSVAAVGAVPLELKQIAAAPYMNIREAGTVTAGSIGIFNMTGKLALASFAGFVASFATTWHGALLFNSPDGLLRIPCAKAPS